LILKKMFKGKKKETLPPAATEMPSKKEIETLYASLLEDLAIPEAKRESMMVTEDDAKKWKLIQAHKTMQRSGKNIKTDEPMYWVGLLEAVDMTGAPTITPEKAQEFETVLRTGHKKFLTEFVGGDGVQSLLALTSWYSARYPLEDRERLTLQRLMEAYKWLMNNQVGMDGMLSIEGSISTLALAMGLGAYNAKPNLASAKEAVLLLAVTCFYSAKGRNMVVAAMDDMRRKWREASRYESLVRAFRGAKGNNEFRAACIMFITTIVNSAASVDARVKVRNDFLSLDVMNVMGQVVKEANENDEHCQTIATQFQVFEDMMVADHAEVIHELASRRSIDGGSISLPDTADVMIDMSDVNAIFRYLKNTTQAAGIPELLLEMFQALLLIPTERSLAQPVWAGIVQFANEATANAVMGKKRAQQKMGKLNYGVLHQILDERLKLDKNLSALASTDDVLTRQRMKIEDLSKQLSQPSEKESGQMKQLQDELKLLREKTASQNEEINRLRAQLFEEQKKSAAARTTALAEVAARPAAAAGGAAAPAPAPAAAAAAATSAEVDPKYVKYYRMKKAGLPEGAILNAMARDNVPVPPNFFDESGPTPSSGGGDGGVAAMGAAIAGGLPKPPGQPQAGGPGAAAAAAAANKPKGPQKPVIKPRTKMRGFFWTKVQADNMQGTIWPEMKDDKVKLDLDTLEKKFAAVEAKVGVDNKAAGAPTKDKVHIVDGKRQQNVGIGVSKLRIANSDLLNAIVKLDETILSLDRTRVLIDLAPTDDEISMLRGYEGDLDLLTTEDRFLYELTNIPRLSTRLKCLATRFTFENEALEIKHQLNAIREACVEVEKSKQLKTLLEIVLAIGNYLNGGTPRGGAWGFKLDALEKLEAFKENEGKKSLIHYIIHLLENNYPGVLETFALPKAEAAINISISETHNDMRNLVQQVRAIRNELQADHSDRNDRFSQVFSGFQLKAEKQMQELEVEFQIVLEDFQRLGERYAEAGPKLEPGALFGNFVKFQHALKHAHDHLVAARLHDEKVKQIEEEKKKRATLIKKKHEGEDVNGSSHGPGVVDAFQKANQGDADTIVLGFRQRHRAASLADDH